MPPQFESPHLSTGLHDLIPAVLRARQDKPNEPFDCDVLIVGSGYGGAVCADALAGLQERDGKPCRVWVLERGNAYEQGRFPTRTAELPGHVRFTTPLAEEAKGVITGLFDVRVGPEMSAVIASGLGGGSLINAGVMAEPDQATLELAHWPQAFNRTAFQRNASKLMPRLGATPRPAKSAPLAKFKALDKLCPRSAEPLKVTVDWTQCVDCGDCATGCNHDAKLSLDKTLLHSAATKGARLVTGAAALWAEQPQAGQDQGWTVHVQYTDPALALRECGPLAIRARRVILAAGAFGSTEILMRSKAHGLKVASEQLGHRFSSNGDMLVAVLDQQQPVNAIATETEDPIFRQVGPTITGMVDMRSGMPTGQGYVIEELAVPGPLRETFVELFTTGRAIHALTRADLTCHHATDADPLLTSARTMERTQVLAFIGHDKAAGVLQPPPTQKDPTELTHEGLLSVSWPTLATDQRWAQQTEQLTQWVSQGQQGGEVILFPLWQPAPSHLAPLLSGAHGPAITAHPLGGCAMADDSNQGVVNHLGQVFTGQAAEVYPDLLVLDGSIMPGSLGINPALSIAAVAQTAMDALIQTQAQWALKPGSAPPRKLGPMQVYRSFEEAYGLQARNRRPTTIEISEQLHTLMDEATWCANAPIGQRWALRLTLRFKPITVNQLLSNTPNARCLYLDPLLSELAIVSVKDDADSVCTTLQHFERKQNILKAPLSGTLRFMQIEASNPIERTLRGGWSFILNRGLRDWFQSFEDGSSDGQPMDGLFMSGLRLAGRAGQVRRFDYDLVIGTAVPHKDATPEAISLAQRLHGGTIQAHKRLTYSRESNPWRQLMTLDISQFPGCKVNTLRPPRMEVNLRYFAQQRVPLMRWTDFDTMPDGLVDIARLGAWLARVIMHTHLWSFRGPDKPRQDADARHASGDAHRLPGKLPGTGLPTPGITEPEVPYLKSDGTTDKVKIVLTHYDNPGKPVVLMIHGFSASGTTFAHPAVNPNLAQYLYKADFDIWVLDMRTSAGLESRKTAWPFEEVAFNDIPVAIERICKATGKEQINVAAHCIGSAMFWMAILGDLPWPRKSIAIDQQAKLRWRMRQRIHRMVMFQIAPIMSFSPANVVRAYVAQYLRQYLPMKEFEFKPEHPQVFDPLLDRLMTTQIYPQSEFALENPLWPPCKRTPWTQIRHRLDSLWGRDFNGENVGEAFLNALDEHFASVNLDNASQTILFAKSGVLTDQDGENVFVTPARFERAFKFDCLYVHGMANGVSDISALGEFERFIKQLGPRCTGRLKTKMIPNLGHQDCLVGEHISEEVFRPVADFLTAQDPFGGVPMVGDEQAWVAKEPTIGPFLSVSRSATGRGQSIQVTAGGSPIDGKPKYLLLVLLDDHGSSVPQTVTKSWPAHDMPVAHLDLADEWLTRHTRGYVYLVYEQYGGLIDHDRSVISGETEVVMTDKVKEHCIADTALGHGCEVPSLNLVQALRCTRLGIAADYDDVVMAVGSCRYPHGMIDSATNMHWQSGPADKSCELLSSKGPDLLMLVGDQIYVDATAGLFDPAVSKKVHKGIYRHWLSNPSARRALAGPVVHFLPDDHEIDNNWTPLNPDLPEACKANEAAKNNGLDAFHTYLTGLTSTPDHPYPPLDYQFNHGAVACYMLDTRTLRELRNTGNVATASLRVDPAGSPEFQALNNWLAEHAAQPYPKVIATPALLLPRLKSTAQSPTSALLSDGWDGYPSSMHHLLQMLWDHQAQQVYFASGDTHWGMHAKAVISDPHWTERDITIESIHSPALYAPFPFANARPQDFAAQETFAVGNSPLQCAVISTDFAPKGDGYVELRFTHDQQGWHMKRQWVMV
jgi:cholesterol oxidase